MTTKNNYITRPEGTLSKAYAKHKDRIVAWNKAHVEELRVYNREYQRKLRANPDRMEEIRDRAGWRNYINGVWRNAYKFDSKVGMSVEQLMAREGCATREEWKEFLKTHESDHIISAKWFREPKNAYLKPFAFRHYNIQFIPRGLNRSKHSWIDESDPRIQLIIARMKMDYTMNICANSPENIERIEKLSREIGRYKKAIKKKFG